MSPADHCPESELLQQLESAFRNYLRSYLTERDLAATLDLLSPTISGYGTALDERGEHPEASRQLFARDIAQAPNPIEYRFDTLDFSLLGGDAGLVRGVVDFHTTIHQQAVTLRGLRLSLIMVRQADRWLVAHLHVSLPTLAHGEEESYPVKELEDRMVVLERLVQERTLKLQEAQEQLRQQAETDVLTGICNRLKGDRLLEQEVMRVQRYAEPMSVILLDLDSFKEINDTLGHKTGDTVLRTAAALLACAIRETDTVARWGGEEFLVLCPSTRLAEAVELAERLRDGLASHDFGISRQVSGSFGVAEARQGECREGLLERADKAMYRAKRSGKNQVVAE